MHQPFTQRAPYAPKWLPGSGRLSRAEASLRIHGGGCVCRWRYRPTSDQYLMCAAYYSAVFRIYRLCLPQSVSPPGVHESHADGDT